MDVLLTCKYKEYLIKNKGARVLNKLYIVFQLSRAGNSAVAVEFFRVLTRLYDVFFRHTRATNSEASGGILPKFELIQDFIIVHLTCKSEENPIKNEGARARTRFSPLYVYGNFFRRSRAANFAVPHRIWLKFEHVRNIMVVHLTCKYE